MSNLLSLIRFLSPDNLRKCHENSKIDQFVEFNPRHCSVLIEAASFSKYPYDGDHHAY